MLIWKRIRAAWTQYLAELEKENKKSFGAGKLDCCQLNRRQDGTEKKSS